MNKYLRAVSVNLVFLAANAIFFLAVTPVAIRVMGEEFYGLWAILSALMLFSSIGNLGVDAVVMKFSAEASAQGDPHTQSNRIMSAGFLIALTMSVITALSLMLVRNLVSDNISVSAELREQFRQALLWIAASLIPQFLARVPQGFLLSQLRNQIARQIELAASVLLWSGVVLIALLDRNLTAIAAWCFFSYLLILGWYLWVIYRLMTFQFQFDVFVLRKMLNFSGYMFLEGLAISLFQHFDKVIVGFTLGPAQAGVYSVGTSLALRLSIVAGQATEVMIPYASLQESMRDYHKLYTVFRRLSHYVSIVLAGLSSLLIIWMDEILALWITPEYAVQYANAFRVLIVAYCLSSLCRPAHQTLTGMGKVKFTAPVYLFSTILMLVTLFLVSRQFGLLGAAASNLTMLSLLTFNLFLYISLGKPFQWRHVLADLQWGLFLPILAFSLSLFSAGSMVLYKAIGTIVLGILLLWVIARDDLTFIKTRLLQIKRAASKT
jgi:O-antigen/teichoic acid export membrane protein